MTDQTNNPVVVPIRPLSGQSVATLPSHSDLTPASKAEGTAQLAACLVLVAPSGMTAHEREEWLKAARMTLSGIPADLLARGCEAARRKCRFPSEIVPTIIETVEKPWAWRKQDHSGDKWENPRIEAPRDCVTAEQIGKLIKSIGHDAN